MKQYRS